MRRSNIAYPYVLYRGCKRDCYFLLIGPDNEAELIHSSNCPNKGKQEKLFPKLGVDN